MFFIQIILLKSKTFQSDYMLWTDASSREFIANNYPWFLDTFDGYTYPIQRADAIRYFVLHHYGGVYLDLDVGCLRPLDPLLVYPAILPKTIPVGVSNDLMFAQQGHPLLEQAIHNLIPFDHSWILNYPTVMFSTGPMFLSAQYGIYTSSHPITSMEEIRILPKSLYGKNAKEGEAPHSFFSHYYGSSWHADDAGFIFGLYTWGKGLMWVGLVILIVGVVWLPTKKRRYSLRRMGGYEVLFRRTGWRSSEPSTQPSSPDISSEDSSPIDGDGDSDVPVLHLPFGVGISSPSVSSEAPDPYAGRASSPIVEVFHRIRNRVTSLTSPREEVQRSPFRSRRQRYSRGVLFFLPAIFTQSQDIELEPTTLVPPRISAIPSRSTSRITQMRPSLPEKPRYTDDIESLGDLRRDILEGLHPHDATMSCPPHEDLVDVDDLPSRPHSRNSNSSRSRSTSRPLTTWDS